jgi:hypothetical protein
MRPWGSTGSTKSQCARAQNEQSDRAWSEWLESIWGRLRNIQDCRKQRRALLDLMTICSRHRRVARPVHFDCIDPVWRIIRIDRESLGLRNHLAQQSKFLASKIEVVVIKPVTLPSGRLKLAKSPDFTGSLLVMTRIRTTDVAALVMGLQFVLIRSACGLDQDFEFMPGFRCTSGRRSTI